MRIITEKDLIIPALVAIYNKGDEGISTQDLIPLMREELLPEGEDLKILEGRNDDKFSQKVRNLKSHNTLSTYTEYKNDKYFINDEGVMFLSENNALPEDSAEITESDIRDQIYDFKVDKSFEAVDDYLSVFDLKRKYDRYLQNNKNNVLILDASFQREGNIWNIKGKSLLIESILLGIPIPSIYVYEGENGNLIVIDGRQRLTTIFDFISDKYKLTGLMFLNELNRKKFSQLDEKYRAKIEDKMFHLRKIRYGSDEKFIIETFKRVNTQGLNLNAQEIRNALHNGKSTELLNKLSDELDISIPKKRMKDRYLMLRYFAMRRYYRELNSCNKIIFGSITDYLSDTMEEINMLDDQTILQMQIEFVQAYIRCKKIYGESAFRLKKDLPINMIIFEISLLFAALLENKTDNELEDALQEFYRSDIINLNSLEETPFEKNIRYHRDSKDNIEERLKWVKRIVEKI
jgi:hypothetical protein